jgi:pantothenate synthetase
MNLTVEELKTIRMGLNKVAFSSRNNVLETVSKVDAMLAEHNLKFEMEAKPKRKWQRDTTYEYVFNPINK